MKLTRQHFQLIAEIINGVDFGEENGLISPELARKRLAEYAANKLRGTNDNFDRCKFVRVATDVIHDD